MSLKYGFSSSWHVPTTMSTLAPSSKGDDTRGKGGEPVDVRVGCSKRFARCSRLYNSSGVRSISRMTLFLVCGKAPAMEVSPVSAEDPAFVDPPKDGDGFSRCRFVVCVFPSGAVFFDFGLGRPPQALCFYACKTTQKKKKADVSHALSYLGSLRSFQSIS